MSDARLRLFGDSSYVYLEGYKFYLRYTDTSHLSPVIKYSGKNDSIPVISKLRVTECANHIFLDTPASA